MRHRKDDDSLRLDFVRTTLPEFIQNLGADRFPFEELNSPFRDVARSTFKFLRPRRRNLLVGLFETG